MNQDPANGLANTPTIDASRQLRTAGWLFVPGSVWPGRVAKRVVDAGNAGVLEYVGRQHAGKCAIPHDHTLTRYCRHGVWRRTTTATLPWTRDRQTRLLNDVCSCPMRMIVSEFHPITASQEVSQGWDSRLRAWLEGYLTQQPSCLCPPYLRLGTALGEDGQADEMFAVLVHDPSTCQFSPEAASTFVAKA
jgi:hypothetical protein